MISQERRAALRDLLEEQRRCGSRGAGSRAALLASGLRDVLEELDACAPARPARFPDGSCLLAREGHPRNTCVGCPEFACLHWPGVPAVVVP